MEMFVRDEKYQFKINFLLTANIRCVICEKDLRVCLVKT